MSTRTPVLRLPASRLIAFVGAIVLVLVTLVGLPAPAHAATVSSTVGSGCSGGHIEYGVASGYTLSPSARSVRVTLPPTLQPDAPDLTWNMVAPNGRVTVSDDQGVPATSLVIPLNSADFAGSTAGVSVFHLSAYGMHTCGPEANIYELQIQVDFLVVASGTTAPTAQLTRAKATDIDGGDAWGVDFEYTSTGSTSARWGDTVAISAPTGFWAGGPDGDWTGSSVTASLQTAVDGGGGLFVPIATQQGGTTALVTLPSQAPPSSGGDADVWSWGGFRVRSILNGTGSNGSGHVVVWTELELPPPPTNGSTPTISGTSAVGATLSAVLGTWDVDSTFAYQWRRDGAAISGARSSTYLLTSADLGKRISVTVVGTSSPRTPTALTSAQTAAVGPRDSTPPTVVSTIPAASSFGFAQTANVNATFSEPVTGVSGTTFMLKQGSTSVPAAVTYNSTSRVATLNPTSTLAADKLYTATISGVKDAAGNTMTAKTWSFTTGPIPTVTSTIPAAGSFGVAVGNNLNATFSEPVVGLSTSPSSWLAERRPLQESSRTAPPRGPPRSIRLARRSLPTRPTQRRSAA